MDFHSWSLDIVRALDHLHNRNPIIMHRDLKPGSPCSEAVVCPLSLILICLALFSANMMLTKDLNTLKLADFGMSKKMSLEERTQVVEAFV